MHQAILEALDAADLSLLGFHTDDASDLRTLISELPNNKQRLTRVVQLAAALRSQVGNLLDFEPSFRAGKGQEAIEEGLVTLLALIAIAPDAYEELRRRSVPADLAWHALADLGQQAHIFRSIFGFLGLSSVDWCTANFTGRLLWLGRLQYTLERDRAYGAHATRLGIHVPATGPLTPAEVDESLDLARTVALSTFRDFRPGRAIIYSWLLDPALPKLLPASSNVVKFADRFERFGPTTDNPRAGLFFGFNVEPLLQPVDLSALPQQTSMERALWARLRAGGPTECAGRLISWDPSNSPSGLAP